MNSDVNWTYSNGSNEVANGAGIPAGDFATIGYTNNRLEGQFIWTDGSTEVVTINVHALDTGGCQIQGTAEVSQIG